MIEAMEQEIINSINNRWTKDKMKRREIDIEKISECFRVICSSRNSTLNIIAKLKQLDELHQEVVDELKSNMKWVYNWITKDMIEDLINKYKSELKDKKREAECKAEIPEIIKLLDQLKIEIVQKTINKLLVFHKVKIGGMDMLEPKREWKTFKSMEEELEKLREWKLISSKATEVKQLYYKGAYTDKPIECKVAGFVDDNEIILYVNGELHSIHPDYLLDMQRKDFSKDILIKEENMNASCPKEKVDKKEKFIIVDIETPFSFSPKDGIREVAAIVVEDYEVVEKLHLAIINDEDEYKKGYGSGLENIEENEILREEFKNLISKYKYPIVAHNASFERNFLRYWKWVDKDQIFYCSMNTMKATVKLDSYKLVNLLKNYNIKSVQKHNAIQDVLDLLELLKRVKPKKWSKLNDSSNDSKVKRNYIVDKKKREEDKERLEKAKENIIGNILNNKSIVFTGDTVISRVEISELAIQYGGSVKSSVSKKTDIVVVGENPGSKLTKAEELGIEILSEDEFLNLINKN